MLPEDHIKLVHHQVHQVRKWSVKTQAIPSEAALTAKATSLLKPEIDTKLMVEFNNLTIYVQ